MKIRNNVHTAGIVVSLGLLLSVMAACTNPAAFSISGLTISATEVFTGESFSASVDVSNIG